MSNVSDIDAKIKKIISDLREEDFNVYFKTDGHDLRINKLCMQSFPCCHDVTYNGKQTTMSGRELYLLFQKMKVEVPDHFKKYEFEENYKIFA